MAISLNNHESRIVALENKKIGQMFPDWSKSTKLSNSATNYKPTSNGYMSFDMYDNQGGVIYINVNGTRYYQAADTGGEEEGNINTFFPVTTSDQITWWYRGPHNSMGVGVFFVPMKVLTIYYIVRYNIYKHLLEMMRR